MSRRCGAAQPTATPLTCKAEAWQWERERENIVLVGSYTKFAQNPAMRTHLLDAGDFSRKLSLAISYGAERPGNSSEQKWTYRAGD